MAKLDVDWAITEIDAFIHATDQVAYDNSGGSVMVIGTHMRGSASDAAQRAHVIEQILDRVLPEWGRVPRSGVARRVLLCE